MTQPRIRAEWREALADAFANPQMAELSAYLRQRQAEGARIYPPNDRIFAALDMVAPQDVKVLIIGQDPYHNPGEANGLAFSVAPGVTIPSSLRNIHKEMMDDLGVARPKDGSLEPWARQGVLLLNSMLTVEHNDAGAHKGRGWEKFTDAVVRHVAASPLPTVFILWGNFAKKKAGSIDESRHLVLRSVHPSGLSASRGFFGSKPFSQANAFLEKTGRGAIDWRLD